MSNADVTKDYLLIGKVTSAFGIKGWVKVYSYTEIHQDIGQYTPWYFSSSEQSPENLQEVTPLDVKPQGKILAARLKGCDDRNQAELFHGLWIWGRKEQLPKLDDDAFYWSDLIGLTVINLQKENLGKVYQVMETGANDVLQVNPTLESLDNQKRLIPYTWQQAIISVDIEQQEIIVDWDADF